MSNTENQEGKSVFQKIADRNTSKKPEKKPEKRNESTLLGFAPKQFVDCCIPASLKKGLSHYERTNGSTKLSLVAVKPNKHDLPCGKDRIFFYWLRTMATLTQSKKIPFPGVNKALSQMGMASNSDNIKWFKQVVLRGHHTVIYFTVGDPTDGGSSKGELIIPELLGLDFETKSKKRQKGYIVISDHFFEQSAIPIDLHMIAAMGRCWLAMDLYTFIRTRLERHRGKSDIYIPLDELKLQFHFPSTAKLKNIKTNLNRAIVVLKKVGFQAIPFFDDHNNFVIPSVVLPKILSNTIQEAFKAMDNPQ